MDKHPMDLLYESKGLNGYRFEDWLKNRTDDEIESLRWLAYSLNKFISQEKESREVTNE